MLQEMFTHAVCGHDISHPQQCTITRSELYENVKYIMLQGCLPMQSADVTYHVHNDVR